MGWWSHGVMGGDTPYDIAGTLADLLGLNPSEEEDPNYENQFPMHLPDCWNDQEKAKVKEALEKYGVEKATEKVAEDCSEVYQIVYQVVGLIAMSCGLRFPPEFKEQVLDAICQDEWAEEDEEREEEMERFAEMVLKCDGTPVTIAQEGLLQKIAESGGRWMPSLNTTIWRKR